MPEIRFRAPRHAGATLRLANGEPPKVAQERLGHGGIAMTMTLFSHVTADMQRTAADRLDAVIEGAAQSA